MHARKNTHLALTATAVLWTAASSHGQSQTFSGLLNEPMGAATLTQGGGHLTVGNIGTDGQDGIRVSHRGLFGHDLEWGPLDDQVFGPALIDLQLVGAVDGVEGQVLSHSTAELVGTNLELHAVFPLAASYQKRVELYSNGRLLAAQDGVVDPWIATVLPVPGTAIQCFTDVHYEYTIVGYDTLGNPIFMIHKILTWDHSWFSSVDYEAWVRPWWLDEAVLSDELRIISDVIVGPILPDHTDILVQGLTELEVFTESIRWEEHRARGRGDALLEPGQLGLLVHDIGSSGQDGVTLGFDAADSATFGLGGLGGTSSIPVGGGFEIDSTGTLGGQPGAELGRLRLVKTPGPFVVEVDHSPVGSSQVRLQLLLDGVTVHQGIYPNGLQFRCPELPSVFGEQIVWWPIPFPGYWVGWDLPLDVVVPGVGSFQVDEARMLAIDPASGVSQIDTLDVVALGVTSFEVTALEIGPILPPETYCQAKTNSQGCVPFVGYEGKPSLSSNDFFITADDVVNQQNGLMIFGFAEAAIPLQGGLLCIQPPFVRTPVQNSGGNALPLDCSGRFSLHFDTNLMTSQGLLAGDEVFAQYWYRDPKDAVSKTGLTNGLRFTIRP